MFYENYLNSVKSDMSFIPESASFKDASIFTERAIQDAFNEAFIGLAMNEMTMFEKALTEAEGDATKTSTSPEKKKEILASIKKFFTFIWGKIKGFFLNIIDKVKEIYTKFKVEKGKVLQKDFTESLDKLAKVKNGDDKFVNAIYEPKAIDGLKGAKSDFEELAKYAEESFTDFLTMNGNGGDDFFEKYSEDAIFIKLSNINSLEKYEPTANGTINDILGLKNVIIDLVFKQETIINDIKTNYNASKKIIDDFMKDAQKIVNKDMDVKGYLKIVSKISSAITKLQSKYLTEAKKIRSNYVSIVSKVIVASKRAVKEDTEITIDVQETPDEDTKVDVKTEPEASAEAPAADVEVKDEVEEAFNALLEEDDVKAAEDSAEGDKVDDKAAVDAVKEEEEVDIEVEEPAEDDVTDSEDEACKESALYKAIVAYLD